LTNSKKLYKLFGKIKKTGITETIYVIAESVDEAAEEAKKFADLVEGVVEYDTLGKDWNKNAF
jgi:hypothetical protein